MSRVSRTLLAAVVVACVLPVASASATVTTLTQSTSTTITANQDAPTRGVVAAGLPPIATDFTLQLHGLSAGFPDELDIVLQTPSNKLVYIMSDNCGSYNYYTAELSFNMANPEYLLDNVPDSGVGAGSCAAPVNAKPSNVGAGDSWSALGTPAANQFVTFDQLKGTDPNGQYKLFIRNDEPGLGGTLLSWSLVITSVDPPVPAVPVITPKDALPGKPKFKFALSGSSTVATASSVLAGTLTAAECAGALKGTLASKVVKKKNGKKVVSYKTVKKGSFPLTLAAGKCSAALKFKLAKKWGGKKLRLTQSFAGSPSLKAFSSVNTVKIKKLKPKK